MEFLRGLIREKIRINRLHYANNKCTPIKGIYNVQKCLILSYENVHDR